MSAELFGNYYTKYPLLHLVPCKMRKAKVLRGVIGLARMLLLSLYSSPAALPIDQGETR
jgi:hypothetical protein